MIMDKLPSVDVLQTVLRYEPESGKLFWLERPVSMFSDTGLGGADAAARTWNTRFAGKEALHTVNGRGYSFGTLFGRNVLAHRLAWALHTGDWPDDEIDHINGCGTDNRIANLRKVSGSENKRNKSIPSNNTSGCIGILFDRRGRKRPWIAKIGIHGKRVILGYFATRDDAIAARKAAEVEYGFHENHGRAAITTGDTGQ